MSSLFLREDLTEAPVGDTVELTGAEAKHAATVNRVRVGETVSVGNGTGLLATGVVEASSPSSVVIRVEHSERADAASPALVLVQALAKGDRDERAVQAATELGVDAIVPWSAERSISRWDAQKAEKGRQRWQTIAREATKQSIRSWLPEVEPLQTTAQLAERASRALVLVLDPRGETTFAETDLPSDGEIVIVVGPEGGVSPAELDRMASAGARIVRLGSTVLRTSTAGPAALAVLNVRLGRW